MSKAFINENAPVEDEEFDTPTPKIPVGAKNYITPGGALKLREELKGLLDVERPKVTAIVSWAASNGDRSENADYIYGKKRLREIDRRIRFLVKRLENIEIVEPESQREDSVRFGATVTLRTEDGEEKTYCIIGVDEIDVKKGWISWVSPLGSALLGSKVGGTVTFRSPSGEKELEILKVEYKKIN